MGLVLIIFSCMNGAGASEDRDLTFVRLRYSEKSPKKPIAMDTAVVHFVSKDGKQNGPTVDLIGAIHIGDKEYYERLNRLFENYDVVLYELVAEEGTRIDKKMLEKESPGMVGGVQNGMAGILKLVHQLHHVDYTKKNMKHADMAPDLFLKRMIDDGEMGKIFARAMIYSFQQSGGGDSDKSAGKMFGTFLATRDKSMALKRAMSAEISKEIDDQIWIFEGDDGSTLIKERNDCAFEKLKEAIKSGKKKIAIFYGAAHLYDMSERLENDYNMKPVKTTWVKAWDMGENAEKEQTESASRDESQNDHQ